MRLHSLKNSITFLAASAVAVGAIAGYFVGYDRIVRRANSSLRALTLDWSEGEKQYPEMDVSQLSEFQNRIVVLTKQEFLEQPSGKKYSENQSEAWCANFVSWVMNEAGQPLSNPNSGSWRIPGTYTLHEYYLSNGRFRPVDSGYKPQLGDVAIYRGSPVFGDHANIILSNEDGALITIGGNEGDRLRIYKNTKKDYRGLLGYGVLSEEEKPYDK